MNQYLISVAIVAIGIIGGGLALAWILARAGFVRGVQIPQAKPMRVTTAATVGTAIYFSTPIALASVTLSPYDSLYFCVRDQVDEKFTYAMDLSSDDHFVGESPSGSSRTLQHAA